MNDNAHAVVSVAASLFTIVMFRLFGWGGAAIALVSVYVITFALNRALLRRKRTKTDHDR